MDVIDDIVGKIVGKYSPEKVILFGSVARRMHTNESDIDLCVVLECEDKRQCEMDMRLDLADCGKALDIIVYTPSSWEKYSKIKGSFANMILEEGEVLYAR